jgi:hypothetical protein
MKALHKLETLERMREEIRTIASEERPRRQSYLPETERRRAKDERARRWAQPQGARS